MLPPSIQLLLAEARQAVRVHPNHELDLLSYRGILQSFDPKIDLTGGQSYFKTKHLPTVPGFQRYCHVALDTARLALPVWEQGINQLTLWRVIPDDLDIELPHYMLELAQGVLEQWLDPEPIAIQLCNELYYEMAGLVLFVTYPVWQAAQACYEALAIVFGGSTQWGEMTKSACEAMAVTDQAEPGEWYGNISPSSSPSAMLYRDPIAQHNFWERWLSGIVPNAWGETL